MKITNEKIDQLAHLSRLEFDQNELLKIKTDVSTTIVKTLGREEYSEKTETKHTGEVIITGINYIVPKENGNPVDTNV